MKALKNKLVNQALALFKGSVDNTSVGQDNGERCHYHTPACISRNKISTE